MANNNPFKPATKQNKRLKMLFYGDTGTRKTTTALKLAQFAGGKAALIDMEGGADMYAGAADIPAFDVLRTKNYEQVMAALDYIEKAKHEYALLILDPITILWNVIVDGFQLMRGDGIIQQSDWGIIKRKMYAVYNRLVNLPIHVIVIAHAKDEYKGKGDNKEKIGEKPDAEKKLDYYFDVILNMQREGSKWFAGVDKARGIALGERMNDLTMTGFKAVFDTFSTDGDYHQDSEDDAVQNMAKTFASEQKITPPPPASEAGNGNGHAKIERPAKPANVVPMTPAASEPPQGDAPDFEPLAPERRKVWFQARMIDGKGAVQGVIAIGQQKNIGMAMAEYFKVETVRRDFLSYVYGVDSYAKLNERQFLTLKKWLNETDPAQIVQEIKLFEAMQQPAESAGV